MEINFPSIKHRGWLERETISTLASALEEAWGVCSEMYFSDQNSWRTKTLSCENELLRAYSCPLACRVNRHGKEYAQRALQAEHRWSRQRAKDKCFIMRSVQVRFPCAPVSECGSASKVSNEHQIKRGLHSFSFVAFSLPNIVPH